MLIDMKTRHGIFPAKKDASGNYDSHYNEEYLF